MNSKLRILGITLVLVLALGGMSSAAQAEEFHSEAESTYLHAEGLEKTVFKINGISVTCKVTTAVGQVTSSTTTEIPQYPVYEECSALGLPAEIHPHGCKYVIKYPSHAIVWECDKTKVKTEGGGEDTVEHEVEITIPVAACVFRIPAQEIAEAVETTNEGSESSRSIGVTPIAEGIEATVEGPPAFCGTNGPTENVSWRGPMLLSGYAGESMAEQVGIWIE